MKLVPTGEMTLGPFFPREFAQAANEMASGPDAIEVTGRVTQMFFPGEPLNESDVILNAIGDAGARNRCIARFVPSRGNALVYEHQLVVRGRVGTPSLP